MTYADIQGAEELEQLPQLSVVQFRGPALGGNNRVVWQLDEAWFPAGGTEYMYSNQFPAEAFPAAVLWTPEDHREPINELTPQVADAEPE